MLQQLLSARFCEQQLCLLSKKQLDLFRASLDRSLGKIAYTYRSSMCELLAWLFRQWIDTPNTISDMLRGQVHFPPLLLKQVRCVQQVLLYAATEVYKMVVDDARAYVLDAYGVELSRSAENAFCALFVKEKSASPSKRSKR